MDGLTFLTIQAFADRLGVHKNTVKGWLKAGLPVLRVARVVRIDVQAADEWLARRSTVKTIERKARPQALPWEERRPTFRGQK